MQLAGEHKERLAIDDELFLVWSLLQVRDSDLHVAVNSMYLGRFAGDLESKHNERR